MRLAIFGGSFDPPHISHGLACLWAVETGEVDRVLMIPCSSHALGKHPEAPFADRVEMCRRAVERISDWVEVLEIEGQRQGVSYTIDTVQALQSARPAHQWRLMIGADILNQVDRWRSWAEIQRLAPPLIIPRMTGDPEDTGKDLRDLSSSQIRRILHRGECARGWLSSRVEEYIRAKRLYATRTETPS